MAGAFESRFMEMICALFSSASSSVGASGVDMSVDDFMDALYLLEIANNPSQLFAVLHPRQIADLQSSIRNETANAIAFNPAHHELMKSLDKVLWVISWVYRSTNQPMFQVMECGPFRRDVLRWCDWICFGNSSSIGWSRW